MNNKLNLIARRQLILTHYLIAIVMLLFSQTSFATFNINTLTKNAHWFEQGNPNAAHQLYVIAEPNCSACHYLYEGIRPYIGHGSLNVRWIMVAFLKPSSIGKTASIFLAKNPAQALEKNESLFNQKIETGGISTATAVSPNAMKLIADNNALMNENGFKQTPIILFKSTAGKWEVLIGAPQQAQWIQLLPGVGRYH